MANAYQFMLRPSSSNLGVVHGDEIALTVDWVVDVVREWG